MAGCLTGSCSGYYRRLFPCPATSTKDDDLDELLAVRPSGKVRPKGTRGPGIRGAGVPRTWGHGKCAARALVPGAVCGMRLS
jgi:hypothetical protein